VWRFVRGQGGFTRKSRPTIVKTKILMLGACSALLLAVAAPAAGAARLAEAIAAYEPEAVAVTLLHAYRHPEHELAIAPATYYAARSRPASARATRDAELLRRVAAFKDYTTICASAPSEILAIIALRARDRILARNRTLVAANLQRLDRFFADWPHAFTWIRPRAGSVAFPRLLGGVSADAFCLELLERESVMLLPGSVFEYSGEHFRIGLGRTNLPDAVARLERFASRRIGRLTPG